MSNLPKTTRYYWDACAWLGLLNRESAKYTELKVIWDQAERGGCEILTSALSQVEVFKKKCEGQETKPLSEEHDKEISEMFRQPHVKVVQLEPIVADQARALLREHSQLKKAPDAIHLATAMFWNCDVMHTYDSDDLLGLDGLVYRRDGIRLRICIPDESVHGPLFGGTKDLNDG